MADETDTTTPSSSPDPTRDPRGSAQAPGPGSSFSADEWRLRYEAQCEESARWRLRYEAQCEESARIARACEEDIARMSRVHKREREELECQLAMRMAQNSTGLARWWERQYNLVRTIAFEERDEHAKVRDERDELQRFVSDLLKQRTGAR